MWFPLVDLFFPKGERFANVGQVQQKGGQRPPGGPRVSTFLSVQKACIFIVVASQTVVTIMPTQVEEKQNNKSEVLVER